MLISLATLFESRLSEAAEATVDSMIGGGAVWAIAVMHNRLTQSTTMTGFNVESGKEKKLNFVIITLCLSNEVRYGPDIAYANRVCSAYYARCKS